MRGICFAVLAPLACIQEYEQVQGEHLLYEYSDELHLCAGTARYMDGLVPFLEHQLALKAPKRLRYSWISLADGWEPLGVPASASRTVKHHAWSGDPTSVHELAHSLTGSVAAKFFTEGVAVAVDDIGPGLGLRYAFEDSQLAWPIFDPRATLLATDSNDVNYATAAAFVRYLLVRHGPEPFHEFYRGLDGPVTMPWLRAQFRRAYDLELDDEIATYRAGIPECDESTYPVNLPECSAPTVPWVADDLWEREISMACDDPGVVGGFAPHVAWPSFYPLTLEVPAQNYYILHVDNPEVTVRIGPCFGCPWDAKDVFLDHGAVQRTMSLEPGKYYLRVNSTSDASPQVTVQLRPV